MLLVAKKSQFDSIVGFPSRLPYRYSAQLLISWVTFIAENTPSGNRADGRTYSGLIPAGRLPIRDDYIQKKKEESTEYVSCSNSQEY